MFSPCRVGRVETRKSMGRPDKRERDAAVLGGAGLGDVEIGHHLEAHGDGRPIGAVQAAHLAQHAVDAVAETQEPVLGLEVDVRRPALDGVREERVHQPHDGLAIGLALRVQAVVVDLAGLDLLQDAVYRQLEAVELIDGLLDLGVAGEQRNDLHVAAEQGVDLVQGHDVEGIRHGHRQAVAGHLVGEGQDPVAARHLLGDELDGLAVHDDVGEIGAALSERPAYDIADDGLGSEAEADQDLAERLPALLLLDERDAHLIGADHALLDQQLPDARRALDLVHARVSISNTSFTARR